MIMAAFKSLDGFREGETMRLTGRGGLTSVLVGDDGPCLSELAWLLVACQKLGASKAAEMVESAVTRSRCPICGGNRFARVLTTRFHRLRTNIVATEQLHCISGRTVSDDFGRKSICCHKAVVVKGVPASLVPSVAVIEAAQKVISAAFTPLEEAQHRDIIVGRWDDAGASDAWTNSTHDGTLVPRSLPPQVSVVF